LHEEWKESVIVPIRRRVIKQIVVIIEAYHFANYIQNFIQHSSVKVNSICRVNYWGSSVWISMYRSTTDHIFSIRKIPEKKWEYSEAVRQLFIDFKEACDSVGSEVLYIFSLSLVCP
jgi:hypothetical protein